MYHPKEFRHTEGHRTAEHWKNEKQKKIKQKIPEEELCGIYTKGGRERGREEGRMEFWEKPGIRVGTLRGQGLAVYSRAHSLQLLICRGFLATSQTCATERKVCKNEARSAT